jgi:hypothetical protein
MQLLGIAMSVAGFVFGDLYGKDRGAHFTNWHSYIGLMLIIMTWVGFFSFYNCGCMFRATESRRDCVHVLLDPEVVSNCLLALI